MTTVRQLEKEIQKLKKRNKHVEADKSWEISYSRRLLLIGFTYLAIGIYLQAISLPNPWLNAIVPAVAFGSSTLTLPFFQEILVKNYTQR